jgi:hypothetical protein
MAKRYKTRMIERRKEKVCSNVGEEDLHFIDSLLGGTDRKTYSVTLTARLDLFTV